MKNHTYVLLEVLTSLHWLWPLQFGLWPWHKGLLPGSFFGSTHWRLQLQIAWHEPKHPRYFLVINERRKAYEIVFQHLGLELLLPAEEEEAIQLQEYYDRMMQQRNAAHVVANPTGVARAAGLRIIMWETRPQGLVQPLVEHTAHRGCPQVDSQNIPTGAPMALNPKIGMGNVSRRWQSEQGRSPFLVHMTGIAATNCWFSKYL